ncbi:MAG: hypothetical protein FGM16_03675 [Flavobacterium sp.]|nr:hypothetical protein [Flavobacterium sp.]
MEDSLPEIDSQTTIKESFVVPKNSWLYPSENSNLLEKGVVLDDKLYATPEIDSTALALRTYRVYVINSIKK